jgi:LmbE family N-acetylglucosaminyl deacetylase
MRSLPFPAGTRAGRRILCLGAHPDDIEIGCGGTLLSLLEQHPGATVDWVVFSSDGERRDEALRSADLFLLNALGKAVAVHQFRDGFFPYVAIAIKECFEELKSTLSPDLIFTHQRNDLHQDHRLISELTWNTFRDHLILEFEVPKYDGDLGAPNVFVPLAESTCRAKIDYIVESFVSQRQKPWFDEETFRALLRLRGMECNAPSRYAEAFYCRKLVLGAAERDVLDGLTSAAPCADRSHVARRPS